MRNWDSLVDSYINLLQQRGLSKSHIDGNLRELESLGFFLKQIRPKIRLEQVTSDLLLKYVQKKTTFKSKATTSGTISRIRCFGEFLVRHNYWSSNPFRWIKGPKLNGYRAVSKSLDREHIAKLYVESFKHFSTYHRYITPAIFSLLYTTGMRKGELISLNIQDWNEKESSIKITSHKTSTERVVPVQEVTARLIEAYLTKRTEVLFKHGLESEQAMFVTSEGVRINGQSIHVKFKRLAEKAGVPVFSLHMLRHSCATDLIAAGVGVPHVQRVLGHACIQSTMRYTHVADPQRIEAIKLHPINLILGATL